MVESSPMKKIDEILAEIPHDVALALIPADSLVVTLRGSLAHGTHIPPEPGGDGVDDIDLMTVYLAPVEFYLGLPETIKGQDIKIEAWDAANYEFRHFCKLLANGNPNVISMLWTDPDCLAASPLGQGLLNARDLFLTKRLGKSFGGYASGQLHRMTSFYEEASACGCTDEFHSPTCTMAIELGRGSSKRYATGFMGAKRKALVKKLGYDAKNAAHAIRLMRMAIEIFRDGKVNVDRTHIDAEELKAIKRGTLPLAEIQAEARRMNETLASLVRSSEMPEEVDRAAIDAMMCGILKTHIDKRYS